MAPRIRPSPVRAAPCGAGPAGPSTTRARRAVGHGAALRRRGFAAVAGADEAGRGACAGPLVAAACVLPAGTARPGARAGRLQAAHRRGPRAGLRRGRRPRAGLVGRRHPGRASSTPAACTSPTSRRCAGRCRTLDARPGLRAHRRVPGRRAGRAGARGVEGRPGRRLRRGRVGARQGHPRPDHARAARALAGVRLRRPQGLHHRRAQRRPRARTGRARSTGCASSTCARAAGRARRAGDSESDRRRVGDGR